MDAKQHDAALCNQIIFIGETLGPFFLEDPVKGKAGPAFGAIATLAVEEAAKEWPFVDDDEANRYLAMMKEGLAAGTAADDLVWEYRRLFIGPAPKPAPPWGSVYTDRECVVFGESTLALRQWMVKAGIKKHHDDKEPEDHIGLMLVLMAWLADNKPEYLEDYLQHHLLTWSSHFLEQLAQSADQPFYEGLARITMASLEGIAVRLGIEVEYPRFYR